MKEPLPMRMSDTNQLPPALRDAFGRLGSETPSAETVLRVQRALEALPAVTPAAAAMGTLGAGKLLVAAALIAGAGTTAVVLQARLGAPQTVAPTHVMATTPELPPPVSSANAVSQRVPDGAAVSQASDLSPPVALAASRHAARTQGRATDNAPPRAKARAAGGTRGPSADLSPHWAQTLLVPSTSGSAQRLNREQSASGQAAAAIPEPASSAAPAEPSGENAPAQAPVPGPSLAAAQAGEAEKLAQCKRLAVREPEAALQQLETLAREAPHGAFVQERELLEIRLHERLGHSARAAQLTQRFLERHPNSVYRRALSP